MNKKTLLLLKSFSDSMKKQKEYMLDDTSSSEDLRILRTYWPIFLQAYELEREFKINGTHSEEDLWEFNLITRIVNCYKEMMQRQSQEDEE